MCDADAQWERRAVTTQQKAVERSLGDSATRHDRMAIRPPLSTLGRVRDHTNFVRQISSSSKIHFRDHRGPRDAPFSMTQRQSQTEVRRFAGVQAIDNFGVCELHLAAITLDLNQVPSLNRRDDQYCRVGPD